MRKLKIVIVTGIYPPDIGGPATYVPFIAKELIQDGHQVRIVTSAEPEFLRENLSADCALEVVKINRRSNFFKRIYYLLSALQEFKTSSDVIYANGLFLETVICNLILRKPLVFKIVGDPSWERSVVRGWTTLDFDSFQKTSDTLLVRLSKLTRKFVVGQADQIIVPSEYLKSVVTKWGSRTPVKVIHNTILVDASVRPIKINLPTKINIVTSARLVSWKRVDQILEAVSEIEELGLVIIGEGRESQNLMQLATRLGVKNRVLFTGALSSKECAGIIRSGSAFILNSTYEGYPHVLLEAKALGVPIIANDIPGVREVLEGYERATIGRIDNKKALKCMLESFVLEFRSSEQLSLSALSANSS